MKSIGLYFYCGFASLLPATKGYALKRSLLRLCGAVVGDGVRICSSAKFALNGRLEIGANTWVGHEVLILGGTAPVIIGDRCDIAPRVLVVTGSHVIDPAGPRMAGTAFSAPVTIGDGSWLCAGATILGGTVIGNHCVVAAGAVVKGTFPDGSIISGIPGRVTGHVVDRAVSAPSPVG